MNEQEAKKRLNDSLKGRRIDSGNCQLELLNEIWDSAIAWRKSIEPNALGYLITTIFDNGLSRLHWSSTETPDLAHGEKIIKIEPSYKTVQQLVISNEERLLDALEQISNLLTHSKQEDYAEVINKCMMIADVAISDWESDK